MKIPIINQKLPACRQRDPSSTYLALNHLLVHLSGGDIVFPRQGNVKVPLVVSKIEIDFASVAEHEAFTVPASRIRSALRPAGRGPAQREVVLGRSHGSSIDIHVWVDLDGSDVGRSAGGALRKLGGDIS